MIVRLAETLHLDELLSNPLAILDILLLALVIYQLLQLIRGTRSVNMMIALGLLLLLHLLTDPQIVELHAFHTVLGTILAYVPIAVIVLFQNQIRGFLSNLGRNPLATWFGKRDDTNLVQEVALAAASLASKRLGALIVIERDMGLRTFYETGILLDARISYDLLMNIFTFRSPMHDGAVIIAENRIKAASCFLPLTTNPALSRSYGTRHRAAFGITEESDALAVVVSEERGVISLVDGRRIVEHLDGKGLERALAEALGQEERHPAARRTVPTGPAPVSTELGDA